MKKFVILLVLFLSIAALLSACGGGGGGGTGGGPGGTGPVAPVSSVTPTRVNGDSPARHIGALVAFNSAGDTGIAVWTEQSAIGGRLLYSMYSSGSWGAENELVLSRWYPVVASDGTDFMVVYTSGAAISAVTVSSTGTKGIPKTIETYNGWPALRIASSGAGKYAVAYQKSVSGKNHVYASLFASGSWSSPTAIENTINGTGRTSTHVIASDGAEYAVAWDGADVNSKYHVYANVSSSGTWSTAAVQTLDDNNNMTGDIYPSIASTGTAGSFGVAWLQNDGTANSVYANIATAGSFSTGGALLEDSSSAALAPVKIAASSSGYAAAWEQNDGTSWSIYANVYTSGSWSTGGTLLENSGNPAGSGPVIASNGTDYAAVWVQSDVTANHVYANIATAGSFSAGGTRIENGSGIPYNLALAQRGRDYGVAWDQDNGGGSQTFANVSSSGTWSTGGTSLATRPWRDASQSPTLATNAQGATLAVWIQFVGGTYNSYGSINSAGTATWSAPFLLSSNAYQPVVATNGAGFMAAYTTGAYVYARTCDSGGALGTPQQLNSATNGVYRLSITSNGTGYAVAWHELVHNIFVNVYNGSSWQMSSGNPNPTQLSSGTRNIYAYYAPAITSNGTGYGAAWMEYNGSAYDVYASVFDGSGWQAASLIENNSNGALTPSIASNGTSYAAAWYQSNGSTPSIYVNLYSSGTWSASGTMISDGVTDSSEPSIASNGTGYAVAWTQPANGYSGIFGNLFDGASWAGPVRIDNVTATARPPMIASDGAGYAAVWTQDDGSGTYYVYSNKMSGAGVLQTASKLETDSTGNAQNPVVVSNGAGYSAAWEKYSSDPIVTDIWVKTGF